MAKGKTHLTYEDRVEIEQYLFENWSLNEIANALNKDPRTISREIRRNLVVIPYKRRALRETIMHYKQINCKLLLRFPYCCNGCRDKSGCVRTRLNYIALEAHSAYEKRLKMCRSKFHLSEAQIEKMDELLLSGVRKGMSPYAIYSSYPDYFPITLKTIYNYIDSGVFQVKNHMLKIKPKLKKGKKPHIGQNADKNEFLEGRRLDDYFRFMAENFVPCPVQMDTVLGSKGLGKCFLTIHFVTYHFMLIFLLIEKASDPIIEVFDYLEDVLGIEKFKELFPCILTDRGGEFSHPLDIEFSKITGEKRTSVFYCDAYVSNQKAQIESNHRMIRYVIPKGTNLGSLSDSDTAKLMEHINSYPRRELGGLSPYEVMAQANPELIKCLKIKKVDRRVINLTPSLLYSK